MQGFAAPARPRRETLNLGVVSLCEGSMCIGPLDFRTITELFVDVVWLFLLRSSTLVEDQTVCSRSR